MIIIFMLVIPPKYPSFSLFSFLWDKSIDKPWLHMKINVNILCCKKRNLESDLSQIHRHGKIK